MLPPYYTYLLTMSARTVSMSHAGGKRFTQGGDLETEFFQKLGFSLPATPFLLARIGYVYGISRKEL